MKKLILILLAAGVAGCTQPDKALRALESAGYTQVVIEGYAVFGCDKNDQFHDRFSAVGANGKPVSGVVCGGFFKGATIRLD